MSLDRPLCLRAILSYLPRFFGPVSGEYYKLIPFLLAGSWDSSNQNDCLILETLSDNFSYDHLERELQAKLILDDSPVWAVSHHRGVVSKIDLLFAIAPYITKADLERYFSAAKLILEEDDPALDLPENQQWQANIYEKKRLYIILPRNWTKKSW